MKTFRIISVLVLALIANLSFAQTSRSIAKVDQKAFEKDLSTQKEKTSKLASLEHSKMAVSQIKKMLVENMVYPEEMLENGVEGQVVLKVLITNKGKIKDASIAKSLNPYFDNASLSAMNNIKTLKLDGKKYDGVGTVYVPIQFSIGQ